MNLKEISHQQLKELETKLEQTILQVNKLQKNSLDSPIIDNSDFIRLMQISSSTAKNWRDKGIIAYAQIENKF